MDSSAPEAEAEVRLLMHKCSPYSQRIQIALLEKGITFEPIIVSLLRKPALLLETNPVYRQVPVIIHNGRTLSQSLVILEYLEDVFANKVPLMPKDPYERAKVRFWADFLHRGFTSFFETCIMIQPECPVKPAAMEGAVKFVRMVDAAMTSYSSEGPFFTGPDFGFLDAVLAPFASFLQVSEKLDGFFIPGSDEIPRFHKWLEAIRARPSVKATIPPAEEMARVASAFFHSHPGLQLHCEELHTPPKFPHPHANPSENTILSSHVIVYES